MGCDEKNNKPDEILKKPVINNREWQFLTLPDFMHYSDPFLKNEARPAVIVNSIKQPVKQPVKKAEKPVEVMATAYKWPVVAYKGLIQNKTQADKMLGIIVLNGSERTVRKGETVEGLTVSAMDKNKVELVHEKEKKIVVK